MNLAAIYGSAVSDQQGIIKRIVESPRLPGMPGLFVINVDTVPGRYFEDFGARGGDRAGTGAGAGLSRTEALESAIGESLERYSASMCIEDDPIKAAYRDLGEEAVNPDDFILFAREQYGSPRFTCRPHDPRHRRRWTSAIEVPTGTRRWIPSQMVYLGLQCSDPSEIFVQSISSGLACGECQESVISAGLRELIERDAFMCMWLLGFPPPRIVVDASFLDAMNEFDSRVLALLRHDGLDIQLRDLTTDIDVPVILAVVRWKNGTRTAVGAASNPDIRLAVRKAVIEAHHSCWWGCHLEHVTECKDRSEVQSFEDHARFYLESLNQTYLDFLDDGPSVEANLTGLERAQGVADIARRLEDSGYRSYYADLTTEDIFSLGVRVGRALVPGLHPLGAGVTNYSLDQRRLRRVCRHWNRRFPEKLNTAPHPFP